MSSNDKQWWMLIILVVVLFFLYRGDPDLHDSIIHALTNPEATP